MKRTLFGVAVVLLLFSASFAPAEDAPASHGARKKQLTLDDIFVASTEAGAPEYVEWSPDGKHLSFVRSNPADGRDELYSVDLQPGAPIPETGHGAVLVASAPLAGLMAPDPRLSERERENRLRYDVAPYLWAPDSKGLLFSSSGQLWFYDLRSGKPMQLTASASSNSDPQFSPDGRYVSFIRDHDLWLRPSFSDKETRLTQPQPSVLNGEVDWVYREELDVRSNYAWAPDGSRIAYLQMDEGAVADYPIVNWGSRAVEIERQKYPRPGEANPRVRLGVVDLPPQQTKQRHAGDPDLGGRSKWLDFTAEKDIYIPRFGWLTPRVVWALALNRAQNREGLYFIDAETGESRLMLEEHEEPYIEMSLAPRFFSEGRFLWTSWRDGHTHLYLYQYDSRNPLASPARLLRRLTRGNWEVLDLCGLDEQDGIVYFTANAGDWRQSNLYQVALDGTGLRRLTPENGVHQPKMAPNAKYFFDDFSTLTTAPRMRLCGVGVAGEADENRCREIWRSRGLDEYDSATPRFVDFTAEDGTALSGVLLLPNSAPRAPGGKFPLILNPYGGPHEQMVRDSWQTISLLDQVMAARGFAILKVDNRGTGNRGKKFARATHGSFGPVELKDQLTALDQVLARYPQLDGERVGWWGWSFGGTLAAYAATHSTRFKAAAAVAPVTDWRLYDSIYAERYLGLPSQNPEGYRASSLLGSAHQLSGRLLLAQGTEDDNVHLQNTIQLAHALIAADKPFDLELYPQKSHGLGDISTRGYLYQRLIEHFERWLAAH